MAFKLENLTKELENSINYYLSLLSDGQFQVEFKLDKEKLNISVINNGLGTPIETVSGGEFSRIQTSILLAIRSLLSKLGGSSINLLFLDLFVPAIFDPLLCGLIAHVIPQFVDLFLCLTCLVFLRHLVTGQEFLIIS